MQTSSEVHIKLQINDFADEAERSAMENGRHGGARTLDWAIIFLASRQKEDGKAFKEWKILSIAWRVLFESNRVRWMAMNTYIYLYLFVWRFIPALNCSIDLLISPKGMRGEHFLPICCDWKINLQLIDFRALRCLIYVPCSSTHPESRVPSNFDRYWGKKVEETVSISAGLDSLSVPFPFVCRRVNCICVLQTWPAKGVLLSGAGQCDSSSQWTLETENWQQQTTL